MKKSRAHMIWSLAILGVFVLLAPTGVLAQLPPFTTGTCDITKVSYVTSSDLAATPITSTFTNLPDMFVAFTIGEEGEDDSEPHCVLIDFSVVFGAPLRGAVEIRVLFDAGPENTIPESILIPPGYPIGYHRFSFIVPAETGLNAGDHQVEIQIRGSGGGSIETFNRLLTVFHN